MPFNDTYLDILNGLLAASREGRVNWREQASSMRSPRFYVAFGNSSVELLRITDKGSLPFRIRFAILNAEGKIADFSNVENGELYYDELVELYDLARRVARGLDRSVKDITENLQGEGRIGELEDAADTEMPF